MTLSIPLLRRDHINFALILNALERQVDIAEAGGAPSLPLFHSALQYFQGYPRKVHHPHEEAIYGALLPHLTRSTSNVFHVIQDHRELAECLASVSEAVRLLDPDEEDTVYRFCEAARQFITRERLHIEMEEGFLYPVAVRLIPAPEWEKLDRMFESESDPLFTDTVLTRYDRLVEDVLLRDSLSQKEHSGTR